MVTLKRAFTAAIFLWLSACDASPTPTPADSTSKAPPPVPSARANAPAISPPKYKVVEENRIPGIKLSLRVMLDAKASEGELRTIATEIRSQYPADFQRVFMVYYLPGMSTESTAWATTNFDPDLKVEIHGATAEQRKRLSERPLKATDSLLGSWFDETWPGGASIRLIRRESKLIVEWNFSDGSGISERVRERALAAGRRLDDVERNRFGEYLIISRDGSLEMYDRTGLFKTLLPDKAPS